MEKESYVLIPAVLIIIASFLSFNLSSLEFVKPTLLKPEIIGLVAQPIPKTEKSLVTGLSVVNSGDCSINDTVFRLTSATNADGGTINASSSSHPKSACFTGTSGSRACTGNNTVIRLSSQSFAHAQFKNNTGYPAEVCFDNLFCEYRSSCSSLGPDYICLASMSSSTNAHLGDCGVYPIEICCSSTGLPPGALDSDNDSVPDDSTSPNKCDETDTDFSACDDNCINTPNGPLFGTCLTDRTITCTQDSDCSSGSCEKTQLDTDNDRAGDVCDDDSTDSCTIGDGDGVLDPGEEGDACLGFFDCENLEASWTTTTAREGIRVNLKVGGSPECNGLTFLFKVSEDTNIFIPTVNPQPATMSSGIAQSSWIAEYHQEADDNTYTFQATSQPINGSSIQVPSSNKLKVTADSNATCGDGIIQGSNNETCDNGSANGEDNPCSENCTLQGIYGDECSNECAVTGLGVCPSQGGTQIRYCGNYDGDPCYDLSNPANCPGSLKCYDSNGDAACIPSICQDSFDCTVSECIEGFRTRSCTNTGSNQCDSYHPQSKIECIEIKTETPKDIPFFSVINLAITILILILYYSIRKSN